MPKPVLVIVGRPNVGKSTLFNRILGRPTAIVEDIPGVTRDLNYQDAAWEDKRFMVVDTGGFYPKHDDNIFVQIKEQAVFAIEEADVIIHLLDGKEGMNPYDNDLVKLLRTSGKPVVWAVNKVDAPEREDRALDFYTLGVGVPVNVSAATGYGFDELMEAVSAHMADWENETSEHPRVAVVGRPNVGKSTLINTLIGRKRLLTSNIPGTTRDAIDTICTSHKRKYVFIDTAGIRRQDRHGYSVERFALVRTLRSIDRADVVLQLLDVADGVTSEDQKIAGLVHEQGKSIVFVMNKWDLVEDHAKELKGIMQQVAKKLFFFDHAPVITISGMERTRVTKLFELVDYCMEQRNLRVPTSELNRIAESIEMPSYRGMPVRIYYMTQYRTSPPGFALFTNRPEGVKPQHLRSIESQLRERFGFQGSPIWLKIRRKGEKRY
jgi:GTP-binding protein